jgi:hypothetical protein
MGVAGWRFAQVKRTLRVRAVAIGVLEELPFICSVAVAIGSLIMMGMTLWQERRHDRCGPNDNIAKHGSLLFRYRAQP